MNTIFIGFSKPKKFRIFAELIKLVFATPYDHVYLKFNSNFFSRDLIYQASKLMVNFMGLKTFHEENEIIREFEVDLTDDQMKALIQFSIDNACKPYGISEALGLGYVRLAEICGRKVKNPFGGGTDNYVCSVLAAYILQNFTSHTYEGDFQDMSPRDVWLYLESRTK